MNNKALNIIKAFTPKQKATFKLLTPEQKKRLLVILLKRSQGTRKPILKRHKKTPVTPVSSTDAIVNSLDIQ